MCSSIINLFEEKKLVKACAPMVRYSKLPFRMLVRKYNCDLCFTPMIIADSFVKSEKARLSEFSTDTADTPLIVQFASTNPDEFTKAAVLVSPYSDGVDLNCGCPQRWVMKLGIGAHLLSEPETIKDIVSTVRNRVSKSYSVSVKLRITNEKKKFIELCRQLEKAGATFLTIHPRTKDQKTDPIDVNLLKDVCQTVRIPVIGNGDIKSEEDAEELQRITGCRGVMAARGLLHNPALFAGYSQTPKECVVEWLKIATSNNLHFITFHHHLVFMLNKLMTRSQRKEFNNFNTYQQVIDSLNDLFDFNFEYEPHIAYPRECSQWEIENQTGSYFRKEVENQDDDYLNDCFSIFSKTSID